MKPGLLFLALLLLGCDFEKDEAVRYLPIAPRELLYHKGDVLAFEVDNGSSPMTGAAIVTDYLKEANDSIHIWYHLVCTDYLAKPVPTLKQLKRSRLFGRKIESSLDAAGYIIGLDIEAVRNDCLVENADKFHLIGTLPLDTTAIKLGSQGATSDYRKFVASFLYGKKKRLLPPDPYDEQLRGDDFSPEEYFPVRNYLLNLF